MYDYYTHLNKSMSVKRTKEYQAATKKFYDRKTTAKASLLQFLKQKGVH
jgi:hypothetical protein